MATGRTGPGTGELIPRTLATVRVGELSTADFSGRLRDGRLGLRMGPFHVKIRARAAALQGVLQPLYANYALVDDSEDCSFHVRIEDRRGWLRGRRRMVRFLVDGRAPHPDLPADQALAVLEWGINLVVALRYHSFLMLHAAVVERHGFALVLPAEPGSGKTTLCAALAHRGWRLLSDEFGMVRPGTTDFIPFPRLMPVKNDAIDVLADFAPEARWGPVIHGTRKGTIRHLRPPVDSIDRAAQTAPVRWVVFPRWRRGAVLSLTPVARAPGFIQIAANAFNYEMLGHAGFTTVRSISENAICHELEYSSLDEAVAALDALTGSDAR